MFEKEATIEITKELAPYAPEEQLGVYKFRRWSWYEKQQAVEAASVILDVKRGLVQCTATDYWSEAIVRIVREYPEGLDWNIDHVKFNMDADIGDILRDTCRTIVEIPGTPGFLEPLDKDKIIPG